jgi:hypothetical protein
MIQELSRINKSFVQVVAVKELQQNIPEGTNIASWAAHALSPRTYLSPRVINAQNAGRTLAKYWNSSTTNRLKRKRVTKRQHAYQV